jgi:phosphohistidine phosphatase
VAKYPDWIYRQSAALAYRSSGADLEVLLITSRKGKRWVFPKGIVEPGLTPQQSAAKEAWEEAGIEGEVSSASLGRYDDKKWGGTCTVEVFPMRVTTEAADWPEAAIRRRVWLGIEEAATQVEKAELRRLLRRLPEAVAKHQANAGRTTGEARPKPRLIYLMRHAKSSWDDPSLADKERPLAPRGRRAGEVMCDYLRLADVEPDLVVCSPSLRTRQTLERVRPAIGSEAEVTIEPLLYHGGVPDLTERLRRLPDEVGKVLLVGHNPSLQGLAIGLSGGGDREALRRIREKFPTAGFAILVFDREHWADLGPGACALHSFVVPRDLA